MRRQGGFPYVGRRIGTRPDIADIPGAACGRRGPGAQLRLGPHPAELTIDVHSVGFAQPPQIRRNEVRAKSGESSLRGAAGALRQRGRPRRPPGDPDRANHNSALGPTRPRALAGPATGVRKSARR